MDDENATYESHESQFISSSVGDNELFSNEENSNQYSESSKINLEINEVIPETGNTVSSSIELSEKFTNQEPLDSPGVSDSQENSNSSSITLNKLVSEEKPAETYKKVKLKRSHILKELCPTVSTSAISTTTCTTSKETEIKVHQVNSAPDNFEDAVSTTSSDVDMNEITSNTRNSSPAPPKKVKLIRNNPRFQTILPKQSVITKIDKETPESTATATSSSSENVTTSLSVPETEPIVESQENKLVDAVTETQKLELVDTKVDSVDDISDVVAQIDQLIGPDDGSINPDSVELLGSDDLNLSEDVDSTKDLSIIDELENEINAVPSSSREPDGNESSNEVLSKIVEDLSDMCPDAELPSEEISSTNLIDSVLDEESGKENENFENIDENFSLVLEDSSDDKDDEREMQIIQSIADQNINEYGLDLEDKVESVDDLEKKLLEVSAEVENLDSVIEMDNLLQQTPDEDSLMNNEVVSSEQNDNIATFSDNILLSETSSNLPEETKTDQFDISENILNQQQESFENFENNFVLENPEPEQSSTVDEAHTPDIPDFNEALYRGEIELPPPEPSNNESAPLDENSPDQLVSDERSEITSIIADTETPEEEPPVNEMIEDCVAEEKEETKLPKLTLTIKKSIIKSPQNNVETISCQLNDEIKETDTTDASKEASTDQSDHSGTSSVADDDENASKDQISHENVAPKLTIKLISPGVHVSDNLVTSTSSETVKEIPKLVISTVNSTTTEGIPKLTIKTVKKPDEQSPRRSPNIVDNSSAEIVPKIIIKPVKKTVEETSPELPEDDNKISDVEITETSQIFEPENQKIDNTDNNADILSSTIQELPADTENQQNVIISTIPVETDDKTDETDNQIEQTPVSTSTFPTEITTPEITQPKYNLSSINMEIIPSGSSQFNIAPREPQIDKDDEEIEVIPSSNDPLNTKPIPKLSIKALKKTIQKEALAETTTTSTELKSIPCSTSSKLIIKPILPSNTDVAATPTTSHSLDITLNQNVLQTSAISTTSTVCREEKRVANILKHNPKYIIKPVKNMDAEFETSTITKSHRKPFTPNSLQIQNIDDTDEKSIDKNDRIVLKIPQNPQKITLKISKEGGHPEILHTTPTFTKSTVGQSTSLKRMLSPETTIEPIHLESKRIKTGAVNAPPPVEYACDSPDISINIVKSDTRMTHRMQNISDDVTIERIPSELATTTSTKTAETAAIENTSKLKDILMKYNRSQLEPGELPDGDVDSSSSDDVKIVEVISPNKMSNDESSSQDIMIVDETPPQEISPPVIKKRGRPRKVPLEIRPELKDAEPIISEVTSPERPVSDDDAAVDESYSVTPKRPYITRGGRRPYRSRRGRGGRGSRGGRGAYKRKAEENNKTLLSLKAAITAEVSVALDKVDLVQKKQLLKAQKGGGKIAEAVFVEEDTRMSADGEMGAEQHTTSIKPEITDESRSSSTTTENNRNKRGRLEISDIDQHVTGPEQIAEYNWGHGGPYMLQEQVAQYLGVKSFKRKYPGLTRHAVDMQERDYIRENGLASEALCDMGLTAVPSAEILDIMFTDFQDKYEEYRKYQREKQAKDVTNKQRAMASSMATNAERGGKEESLLTKAVRSAASWNAHLNKTRNEQRRCYLDLQSFTVMYPKGRRIVTTNTNPGNYPVSLVPGQFSEYYRKYSSTELKYLPINTVLYGPVVPNRTIMPEIGHSDGSESDSDSSSGSDSDTSDDSDSTTMDGITTPIVNASLSTLESDTCKICAVNSPKSRPPKTQLIFCAQCNAGIHPRCIDLTPEMMPFIQAYPWQCTDCKTCWQCQAPSDDDKMLFCDRCDRGYHIYCVGLRKVPNGRWHCQQCTATTSTSTTPIPFMTTVQSN